MSNFEKNYLEVPQDNSFNNKQTDVCKMFWLDENHEISKTFQNLRESYSSKVNETIKSGINERIKLKEIMENCELREANANANVIKLAWVHNQLHNYFDEAA